MLFFRELANAMLRVMSEVEKAMRNELCYFETSYKPLYKVVEEQVLLWLFPIVLLLIVWKSTEVITLPTYLGYAILALLYVFSVSLGTWIRFRNERKTAYLMEEQSKSILEEFRLGLVESLQFNFQRAYLVEEVDDEGPLFVLEIEKDQYTIFDGHGKIGDRSSTPGNTIEVTRLPTSKRILDMKWSGQPIMISRMIDKTAFEKVFGNLQEGDILTIDLEAYLS